MGKRFLAVLLILLIGALPVKGQVTIPNTFVAGSTASAAQVNANFAAVGAAALNRTGGTVTGNIAVESGFTIDGVDISSILGGGTISTGVATFTSTTTPQLNVRYDASNHLAVSVSSVGGVTFNSTGSGAGFSFEDGITVGTLSVTTFTCTGCVGATQIAATTVTAATYGNGTSSLVGTLTVDADGRLTSVAAANASSLTGIVETAITDGSLLARLGSSDTWTGTPSFSGNATINNTGPYLHWSETEQTSGERSWLAIVDAKVWQVRAYNDALTSSTGAILITRGSGTAISNIQLAATTLTFTGNATVTGTSLLTGAVTTSSSLAVGTALSSASLGVTGTGSIGNDLSVTDQLEVGGNATFNAALAAGATTVSGLTVGSGDITFSDTTQTIKIETNSAENSLRLSAVAGDFSSSASLELDYNDGIYISAPLGQIIELSATGGINWEGHFVPLANNTYDIGTSTNRVRTIYSNNVLNVSDEREKRDIKDLTLGIEFIDKLVPKEFYWRSGKVKTKQLGFLAQDLLKVNFPGVDTSNPDSYLVNYNHFFAPIVKGLQEVHKEVHEDRVMMLRLLKRVEALEAKRGQRAVEE